MVKPKKLKSKKKIIFLIDKENYIRNYTSSGLLLELKKNFNLTILIKKNLLNNDNKRILKNFS